MDHRYTDKNKEHKSSLTAGSATKQSKMNAVYLEDNREKTILQRKFQEGIQNRVPKTAEMTSRDITIGNSSNVLTQRKPAVVLKQPAGLPKPNSGNNTGLPDGLKAGIENMSGHSMDDVKVHYNSSKPAQLQAHAYAMGTEIHLGPGQEKHLPHEAWHVVQQKQGRVAPTLQMKGIPVNDHPLLEKEADAMGARASQKSNSNPAAMTTESNAARTSTVLAEVVQMVTSEEVKLTRLAMAGGLFKFLKDKQVDITIASLKLWKKGNAVPSMDQISPQTWSAWEEEYLAKVEVGKAERADKVAGVVQNDEPVPPVAESGLATVAFDKVRAKIGEPLNNGHFADRGEERPSLSEETIGSAGALYEDVKQGMGIIDADKNRHDDSRVRLEWMLETAALGSALGAGVCNSIGALTALILHISGEEGVKFVGNDVHNWAEYGRESKSKVDPWKNETHTPEAVNPRDYTIVDLPEHDKSAMLAQFKHFEKMAASIRDRLLSGPQRQKYLGYVQGPYPGRNHSLFPVDAPPPTQKANSKEAKKEWVHTPSKNTYAHTNQIIGRKGTGTSRAPLSQQDS